jgi:hypothetical protein
MGEGIDYRGIEIAIYMIPIEFGFKSQHDA